MQGASEPVSIAANTLAAATANGNESKSEVSRLRGQFLAIFQQVLQLHSATCAHSTWQMSIFDSPIAINVQQPVSGSSGLSSLHCTSCTRSVMPLSACGPRLVPMIESRAKPLADSRVELIELSDWELLRQLAFQACIVHTTCAALTAHHSTC